VVWGGVEDDCNWAHVEPGESIALQSAEGHKTLALREPGSSAPSLRVRG